MEAARELAGCTRFATPEPVAIGEPGGDHPVPWLVQSWLDGTVAKDSDPSESEGLATDFAELSTGVHRIDTRGRRHSGYGRGGHLADHDDRIQECLARSEGLLDVVTLTLYLGSAARLAARGQSRRDESWRSAAWEPPGPRRAPHRRARRWRSQPGRSRAGSGERLASPAGRAPPGHA